MTFKIGDQVRVEGDPMTGEVLEVRDDNVSIGVQYLIKWDRYGASDWEHESYLVLVDAEADAKLAKELQSKIDQAQSALELAYQAYSTVKGCRSFHYLVGQDLINMDKFRNAAENFGWSSSSLHC
jgi:hypothetical protein